MAKQKITTTVEKVCDGIAAIGRWIGARRVLFVWSAFSVAVALFFGITKGIRLYGSNADINVIVLAQFLDTVFMFLKLFVPMFMLVVATKYIFDSMNRTDKGASETLRLSFAAAVLAGLAIAALYYLDAGHIIGEGANCKYCDAGKACYFSWDMVGLAGKAFLASSAGVLLTILGLRGIYTELSFMLSGKK
jgi:hypothetical protein